MAIFYRGAGLGTHWHTNDARASGFSALNPSLDDSVEQVIRHISTGTSDSPYVSLTRSYEVAWTYAVYFGKEDWGVASEDKPGYVYELEIDDVSRAKVIDPITRISSNLPSSVASVSYQHDGGQDVLLGLVNPRRYRRILRRHVKQPPPAGATPRGARITGEVEAIVRALRDAELLAIHRVHKDYVVRRYPVW